MTPLSERTTAPITPYPNPNRDNKLAVYICPRPPLLRTSPTNKQYFGLVGGTLSIMTKVDPMEPRPGMAYVSPGSWLLDTSPRHDKGARGSDRALRVKDHYSPYNRAPHSAQEAPATKPVEAPEPPPWSGSKIMNQQDLSEKIHAGAGEEQKGPTVWGSRLICLPEADLAGDKGGERPRFSGTDQEEADAEDTSSCLSPWAVCDDDSEDDSRRWGFATGAPPATTTVGALDRLDRLSRRDWNTEASGPRSTMTGPSGGGGGSPKRWRLSATAAFDEVAHLEDTSRVCYKPQPELYDIWIPQQSFQGKALAPSKQWRGVHRAADLAAPTSTQIQKRSKSEECPPETNTTRHAQGSSPVTGPNSVDNGVKSFGEEKHLADDPSQPSSFAPSRRRTSELSVTCAEVDPKAVSTEEVARNRESDGIDGVREGEEEDEYFDYATRFSWHAAAAAWDSEAASARLDQRRARHGNDGLEEVRCRWSFGNSRCVIPRVCGV